MITGQGHTHSVASLPTKRQQDSQKYIVVLSGITSLDSA